MRPKLSKKLLMLLCALPYLAFSGCASKVTLEIEPPRNYILAGDWILDPSRSSKPPRTEALRARGFTLAMVAQDFQVIRSQRMEIEQSSDSIGISYDRNSYRDVSWGKRIRGLWEVYAGCIEQGDLLILSTANDAEAKEVFQLNSTGSELTISIEINTDRQNLSLTRTFIKN